MRMANVTVWVTVLAGMSACRTAPEPPSPFALPPQLFFDSVHTIVVASVSVVGDIAIADSTLSQIESAIESKLRETELKVVSAVEYAAIWERITAQSGGFFDPYTGERIEERYQTAVESLHAELAERFGFDAILYPEVWEVVAPFDGGEARWGGVARMITGARGYSGDVRAATLYLVIQDEAGNELYAQEAGIQVIEYMLRGRLTPIEPERLFEDSTWTVAAVWHALDPIVQARSTAVQPP